jgi:hypothetical protein
MQNWNEFPLNRLDLEEVFFIYEDTIYTGNLEAVDHPDRVSEGVANALWSLVRNHGGDISEVSPINYKSAEDISEKVIEPFLASHGEEWSSQDLARALAEFINSTSAEV